MLIEWCEDTGMENNELRLIAFFNTSNQPMKFEFNAELPTVEQAREFAAQFPKSTKIFATRLSCIDGVERGWVVGYANLTSDGVNGGVNESGVKRYHAIVKAAAKLGITINYAAIYGNSYPTREAFEEALEH